MWLALIICLSGYASAACSPSVSNWVGRTGAGPCIRLSSSSRAMPSSASRTGAGVCGSAARIGMVAVICEASTWFWISRLFSSGTLT